MADVSKAQKLASAKKRFKELKEQKKNISKVDKENEDSNSSSEISQKSVVTDHIEHEQQLQPNESTESNNDLTVYFDKSDNKEVAHGFFDNFIVPTYDTQSRNNAFNKEYANNSMFPNYYSPVNNVETDQEEVQSTNPSTYFAEIQENLANSTEAVENAYENYSPYPAHKLLEPERDSEVDNVSSFNDYNVIKFDEGESSNVESLEQLSQQFSRLIGSNNELNTSNGITDLEKRNLELAAHLQEEKLKVETLTCEVDSLKSRIAGLDGELSRRCDEMFDMDKAQELSRLKEELQHHIQTVGVLVAEKTELTSNLSQTDLSLRQKLVENEELQARLKTSRSLVADLEKEIAELKLWKEMVEGERRMVGEEVVKTQEHIQKERQAREELAQDLLELKEKLVVETELRGRLEVEKKDLQNKLSLAEIRIQQLTVGDGSQVESKIEKLTQENFELERRLAALQQGMKTMTKERDEASAQYQQYAQQLNQQITNLSLKLEQLNEERENLMRLEEQRIRHIGELEKQLQNLEEDKVFNRPPIEKPVDDEVKYIKQSLLQAEEEKESLFHKFTKVSNEKDMLMKELEAKNDSLRFLESQVEQLRGNQPDSVKLLATMESDKVAAARAITQNKELKQQLESMQEVFVKLNDDKLELTESFNKEKQRSKEFLDKLQKTEVNLQMLAEAIEIKDRELSYLRESCNDLTKQNLQQQQLSDRLRHYEAQDNSSLALQKELEEARSSIQRLTEELAIKPHSENVGVEGGLVCNVDEHLDVERLRQKLQILEKRNQELEQLVQASLDNRKIVDENDVMDKELAMKYLEDKFTRKMNDIAELQEEKQRLEHLVLQLQGETETIGEYVALYQHQRGLLKQKAVEKDQQLKQLANDREQLKEKLHKLNNLVKQLLNDKKLTVAQDAILVQSEGVLENDKDAANEIIDLLSEIECSNLVRPGSEIHHCSSCHGKLMTV